MMASPRLLSCCSAANGKQVNNYGLDGVAMESGKLRQEMCA